MADPSPSPQRRLDFAALRRTLRRLASAPTPPWLHAEIAKRLAERLDIIRLKPERIVDWSGFLGAGREPLAAVYPKARRVVVEPDDALAARSRALPSVAWWSPRRLITDAPEVMVGDETLAPGAAQLVWSNMSLQGVKSPPSLMARWQRALAIDGFVMFSCLGPGTLVELRDLYRCHDWPAPMLDFVDMHDLGDMLVQAGFADPVMDQETLRLNWAGPVELLTELRAMGANVSIDRHDGLRTPRWRARLMLALEGLRGDDGRLSLSFEVVYGHAFKGLPRAAVSDATNVSLEDMRALLHASRSPRA